MAKTPVIKRYFTNNLNDYIGGTVEIPKLDLRQRCLDYVEIIFERQSMSPNSDGSLYVGLSGIAFMCYVLGHHPDFEDKKPELLAKGEDYAKIAAKSRKVRRRDDSDASFLLGECGVFAVNALFADFYGRKDERQQYLNKYSDISALYLLPEPSANPRYGFDELFLGRAGYLCGIFMLEKKLGVEVHDRDHTWSVIKTMYDSGRYYSEKTRSLSPLMYEYCGTQYLGAAHGLSSILLMFLCHPDFLDQHSETDQTVRQTVDYLLSLQNPDGNFSITTEGDEKPRTEIAELVHWCHGAPGIVYTMGKAYLRWGDPRYLDSSLKCGELVWNKGLLKKGPGLCHGIAGNGYVFLFLYNVTQDQKHLHRALEFALFLFSDAFERARIPDAPFSLFEGIAGTVVFLSDMLQPENAHYPFLFGL